MAYSEPTSDYNEGMVSVIIPHYNAEKYLLDAIRSVLIQDHKPLEIIIIDSSNSCVAKSLANNFRQIIYEFREPDGVASARNQAIDISSGEYIALLDADDLWLTKKLETVIPKLYDADVVYSDMYVMDGSKMRYYETKQFDDHVEFFRSQLEIPSRTVVAHRSVFNEWRFNEELKAREDPNLWTKLLSKYEFKYVAEPTGIKRIRENSLTTDQLQHTQAMLESLEDLLDIFPELRPYEKERRITILVGHARNHLAAGNNITAAKIALKCITYKKTSLKVLAILACSLMPNGIVIYKLLSSLKNNRLAF